MIEHIAVVQLTCTVLACVALGVVANERGHGLAATGILCGLTAAAAIGGVILALAVLR